MAHGCCRVFPCRGILAALSNWPDLQKAKHDKRRPVMGCGGRRRRRHFISAGTCERHRSVACAMKKTAVIIGIIGFIAGVLAWQMFGSRRVPQGQPPLANLTEQNFSQFENSFDDSAEHTRVLALLSPT